MKTDEFVKTINSLRLANKNQWYALIGTVNGKQYKIKGYKTWLQLFIIDGISHNGNMDISVKDFKEKLASSANYHINK